MSIKFRFNSNNKIFCHFTDSPAYLHTNETSNQQALVVAYKLNRGSVALLLFVCLNIFQNPAIAGFFVINNEEDSNPDNR